MSIGFCQVLEINATSLKRINIIIRMNSKFTSGTQFFRTNLKKFVKFVQN